MRGRRRHGETGHIRAFDQRQSTRAYDEVCFSYSFTPLVQVKQNSLFLSNSASSVTI